MFQSTEMLIDGLIILGVTPEVTTAIVGLCDSGEKKKEMMLYMAEIIDSCQKTNEKELLNKAIEIAKK